MVFARQSLLHSASLTVQSLLMASPFPVINWDVTKQPARTCSVTPRQDAASSNSSAQNVAILKLLQRSLSLQMTIFWLVTDVRCVGVHFEGLCAGTVCSNLMLLRWRIAASNVNMVFCTSVVKPTRVKAAVVTEKRAPSKSNNCTSQWMYNKIKHETLDTRYLCLVDRRLWCFVKTKGFSFYFRKAS